MNPAGAEECANCHARLTPVLPPSQGDQESASGADWLSNLRSSDEGAESFDLGGGDDLAGGEMPDWLARIREDQAETTPETVVPADQTSEPAFDIPDWMHADSQEQAEITPDTGLSQADSDYEIPDWLQDTPAHLPESAASFDPESTESPAEPAFDIPQWLQDDVAATPPAALSSPFQADREADQEQGGVEQPITPAGEGDSAWLAQLQSWQPGENQPDSETPAENEGSGGQEWLSEYATWQPDEEQQASGDELTPQREYQSQAEEAEIPEWLGGITPANPPDAAESFDGVPEWLLSEDAQTGAEAPTGGETSAGSSAMPDWLAEERTAQNAPGDDEYGVPDWLTAEETPETPATPAFSGLSSSPLSAGDDDVILFDNATPDWLAGVGDESGTPVSSGNAVPAFSLEDSDPLPLDQDLSGYPFAGEELPDWLAHADRDDQEGVSGAAVETPLADGLAPAQLPGWLEAMRPSDVVPSGAQTGTGEQHTESSGPLAGLQGILPVQDAAVRIRKLPTYSVKLKVSEVQRSYADLLQSIIEQESKPQESGGGSLFAQSWLVRLALAAILILAVLITGVTGRAPQPLDEVPLDLLLFVNQVEAVPQGAPVLLIMDYDAAAAGEMRYAAGPVVERLMLHSARLSMVSSVPTGPVLGQNLLEGAYANIQSRAPQGFRYEMQSQVLNMGFLPGGATSMQEFLVAPLQVAPGMMLQDDQVLSGHPALAGVGSLGDFGLVVLLTGSDDTGRSWIEQLQPSLTAAGVPMLVVSTAQAAPMLRPYADGGQVQGMLSGMSAGTGYGLVTGSTVSPWWTAYQTGLFLGILFLLAGAFYGGAARLFTKSKG